MEVLDKTLKYSTQRISETFSIQDLKFLTDQLNWGLWKKNSTRNPREQVRFQTNSETVVFIMKFGVI